MREDVKNMVKEIVRGNDKDAEKSLKEILKKKVLNKIRSVNEDN